MNSPAPKTTTMTNHNLAAQLKQIGLCALPTQLDDFIARVTKARCSAHQILEELAKAERLRTLPPQPGTAIADQRHQEIQAHG